MSDREAELTDPQQQLLDAIREIPRKVVAGYPPAKKLVQLGLAVWDKYGRLCPAKETK